MVISSVAGIFSELGSVINSNINEVRQLLLLPVLSVLYLLVDRKWFGKEPYEWNIPLDDKIPIIPWTVFIYNSWYPVMILIYFKIAVEDKTVFTRLIPAYLLIHLISLTFFMFFQNKVIRREIPGNGLSSKLLYITRHADNPYNGCPSVHVSTSTLTILAVLASVFSPAFKILVFIWQTLIIISTLTTEQHITVDVIFGTLTGIICWMLAGFIV